MCLCWHFIVSCDVVLSIVSFFFFKQMTAYEVRISDWSSDVCSSDLTEARGIPTDRRPRPVQAPPRAGRIRVSSCQASRGFIPCRSSGNGHVLTPWPCPAAPGFSWRSDLSLDLPFHPRPRLLQSSEERRVGKEFVSPFRSRWSR